MSRFPSGVATKHELSLSELANIDSITPLMFAARPSASESPPPGPASRSAITDALPSFSAFGPETACRGMPSAWAKISSARVCSVSTSVFTSPNRSPAM